MTLAGSAMPDGLRAAVVCRECTSPFAPLETDRRPVVLVVDDEPMMRWFMTTALRDHFRVLVAADGQEALETVREVGDEIAALVTDIRMPHLDGLELAAAAPGDGRARRPCCSSRGSWAAVSCPAPSSPSPSVPRRCSPPCDG